VKGSFSPKKVFLQKGPGKKFKGDFNGKTGFSTNFQRFLERAFKKHFVTSKKAFYLREEILKVELRKVLLRKVFNAFRRVCFKRFKYFWEGSN